MSLRSLTKFVVPMIAGLILAGCGGNGDCPPEDIPNNSPIVGTWTLDLIAQGEATAECPGEIGEVSCTRYTNEFQPDGDFIRRSANGQIEDEGTWDLEGETLTVAYDEGGTDTYVIDFTDNGDTYTYERNVGEPIYHFVFIKTANG